MPETSTSTSCRPKGGEPKRLTWHPGADMVEGWTPDGRSILFSSTRATWAQSDTRTCAAAICRVFQPLVAGLLGADFTIDNSRYKVTRIYDNESWNPDLGSPLATPGANVNAGDYILAINGIELRAPDNKGTTAAGVGHATLIRVIQDRQRCSGKDLILFGFRDVQILD